MGVTLEYWMQKVVPNILGLLQNFRNSNRIRDIQLFLEIDKKF